MCPLDRHISLFICIALLRSKENRFDLLGGFLAGGFIQSGKMGLLRPVIRLLCQTELFRRLSHLLFVIVLELRQFFGVLFIRPWLDRRLVYIDDLVGWQRGEIFVWGCAVKDAEIQLPHNQHIQTLWVKRAVVHFRFESGVHCFFYQLLEQGGFSCSGPPLDKIQFP